MRGPHRVVHVRRRLEVLQLVAVILAAVHRVLHGAWSPGANPAMTALAPTDRRAQGAE